MYIYKFDKDNCWYKNTCNKYNTNSCNSNCIRYMEIHYLMESSNIPKSDKFKVKLQPSLIDKPKFEFLNVLKNNINEFVANGKSLYIYSSQFGNGKTTWAIKIMQKYFDTVWAGNGFTQRGLFIHTPSFLTKFKEVINKKDENFELMKEQLLTVDLVIWDDIATSKLTEYDHTNLLTYIDQRILNGKSNIFTGNLDADELAEAVGNRLKSRIWNNSIVVELNGNDQRGGNNGSITNIK